MTQGDAGSAPMRGSVANGWIPVTERLPDAGVDVLIWSPIDPQFTRFCVAAMDRINGQHLWTSEYGDEMPTHWMPLPAPPLPPPPPGPMWRYE